MVSQNISLLFLVLLFLVSFTVKLPLFILESPSNNVLAIFCVGICWFNYYRRDYSYRDWARREAMLLLLEREEQVTKKLKSYTRFDVYF